jgi:hypothetical protein
MVSVCNHLQLQFRLAGAIELVVDYIVHLQHAHHTPAVKNSKSQMAPVCSLGHYALDKGQFLLVGLLPDNQPRLWPDTWTLQWHDHHGWASLDRAPRPGRG